MTLFWKSVVALTLVVLEAAAAASVADKSSLIATKLRKRSAAAVSRDRLSDCDANYHMRGLRRSGVRLVRRS